MAGEAGEAGDMGRIREIGERHERASAELRDLWSEYERLGEQIEQEPPAGRCEENRP